MVPFRSMLVFLLLACGQAAASEFTVDAWELDISVLPPSGSGAGDFIPGIVNPFSESHQVEYGPSSASASYDFAWDDSGGHFSIESQLAAELISSSGANIASSHGWIKITPSVDLAFHVDATMSFNLPRQSMEARVNVWATDAPYTLFDELRVHDTFTDGLGSGTLSMDEDFIMPAGTTWRLSYDLYLDTYMYQPGGEGAIGTATGNVDISFTVLPEPSTLGLLAIAGCMMLRHKRKPQAPPTAKTPS